MAHIEIMGKEADGMQCSSVYCEDGIDAFESSIAQQRMAQHSIIGQHQIQPLLDWVSGRQIWHQVDAADNGKLGLSRKCVPRVLNVEH